RSSSSRSTAAVSTPSEPRMRSSSSASMSSRDMYAIALSVTLRMAARWSSGRELVKPASPGGSASLPSTPALAPAWRSSFSISKRLPQNLLIPHRACCRTAGSARLRGPRLARGELRRRGTHASRRGGAQSELEFEAALRVAHRRPEDLAQPPEPVADGLRVDLELVRDRAL